MPTIETEIVEARMTLTALGDRSESVTLDEETTRVIYSHCWAQMERHLVEANAAYNSEAHSDPFERASDLRDSLRRAYEYADVLLTLTAVPLDDEDE